MSRQRFLLTFVVVVAILVALVISASIGKNLPSNASNIAAKCKEEVITGEAGSYDFGARTINSYGRVTGWGNCGTDGSVQSWVIFPRGSGDPVYLVLGQ